MPTPILICDDSSLARKQLARSLPPQWDATVSFANDGREAIEAIKQGKGEILFLDLNMPVMDGYEVLETIRQQDLATMVIVVSGDIQPVAHKRVLSLGALAFIRKPVQAEQIETILTEFGISIESNKPLQLADIKVDFLDSYKELANVATGRAADLLARLLDAFVIVPIPNVNMLEVSELCMALQQIEDRESVSAVSQGVIGAGISGEALLIFNESSFDDIAALMKYRGNIDESIRLELLMDISCILIGASLKGIADQLDITFSQSHPIILGQHVRISDILKYNAQRWNRILAIEIPYRIEHRQINCELLLMFTEDSVDALNKRISYVNE
jgi:chemotaxis protein CheY-P-specific phosphatase CheC